MKLGLVVQRYGPEVVGGAELHCRWVAEHLAERHRVEVLTTTATDYLTWENVLPPGVSEVSGVTVRRFPVARSRRADRFDEIANKVCFFEHTDEEERRWLEEHGPVTPALVEHLRAHHGDYDALVFFSYRYWTTYHGLQVAPRKSLLVPTAEHDRVLYLRFFAPFFQLPAALVYNSPEERHLIQRITKNEAVPGEVVGTGINRPASIPADEVAPRLDLLGDYLVYVGRIEPEKGCAVLLDHFLRWQRDTRRSVTLALFGKGTMEITENVHVRPMGVVTEAEKLAGIARARALLMPSRHESLSMVVLEAWMMQRPVLVNGDCEVLRGQVLRSGGGLYYRRYEEFAAALDLLLDRPDLADTLGAQGHDYFQEHYTWPRIMEKYERLLARAAGGTAAGAPSSKLAFVIQRYGVEIAGGAELHCRWLAERLARRHQVEVFATRAQDYLEWRNHYPAGTENVNGIPVHRFTVRRKRSAREFASLCNVCFYEPHTREEEEAWVRANGPYSPALVDAVAGAHGRFDRFFFYCYRYYQSYHGLPRVRDRAILVPTAEEDPAIGLQIFKAFFRSPRGIVYLTPEEQSLVEDASGNRDVPSVVIGSGLNMAEPSPGLDFRAKHGLTRPFLLYVGRVDKNKGCVTLLAYFRKFQEETGADIDLVLAGKAVIPVPDHPHIRPLGYVSEEEKVAALRQCRLLVMPSPYESLSIITLEAWKMGVPVLANARCRVLMGQCLRSNGGLFYHGYAEFAEGLKLLLDRPEVGRRLGEQGRAYVEDEYSWERVEAKVDDLLARTGAEGTRASGGVA